MISLKNVSAGYGKELVLNAVNVDFEKGKLVGIIGTNGSGKTTLLKTMLGILPVTYGSIELDGKMLSSMSRTEIARSVAYLSQGKNTPDMTVFQMVLHGRFPYLSYPRRYSERDRKIAYEALEKVGISNLAGKSLSDLSGGIRQIAYIAMALAQDADYILLDEPTTYLDITHQLSILRMMKSLAENGRGIVAVMHDLPFAFEFCDEIAVVHNGAVIIKSKPSELCKEPIIEDVFNVRIDEFDNGRFCINQP